jgi:hypothetical protein
LQHKEASLVQVVAAAGLSPAGVRSAYDSPAATTRATAAETNEYVYVPVRS